MTLALRHWRERSVDAPYGHGESEKVELHNKIAVRTCNLCRIKHAVGDAFSLEHIWPTDLVRFECYKELLSLPGIFAFTFDNCMFGERYRHRQVLIVNQPWMMALCRDCDKSHKHLTIGFDGDIKTWQVSPFAAGLVEKWVEAFVKFLKAPSADLCPLCYDLRQKRVSEATRSGKEVAFAVVERLASVVGHAVAGGFTSGQLSCVISGSDDPDEVVLRVGQIGPGVSNLTSVDLPRSELLSVMSPLLDNPERRRDQHLSSEKALKATRNSYKSDGKKQRQEEMFPELMREVEAKRAQLDQPLRWPDPASRLSEDFRREAWKKSEEKIGGSPEEKHRFFEAIVMAFPQCFWMEGCEAPTVRDHVINFRVKPGAKPVARQPIPLSPYDNLRVEYHIAENVAQGKLRRIRVGEEALPEWSTPVFIVDQDAKGLLGRMVCAYGPVNSCLEITTFPSADPQVAFDIAAFKKHHTVVDAIWGYTQFLLDDSTKRLLVVCARSGLYEWLRMPFGPAPAPAEMQSYVATRFGSLRDRHGLPFCTPLMDDISVSSSTLEEHIEHLEQLLSTASESGFEFKLAKAQFNQEELELWGCICGAQGRRAQPRKIQQLTEWPIPTSAAAVNSFLCFVNYLRDYMDPEWVKHELTLRPFRKKEVRFEPLWSSDPKYEASFRAIRTMLSEGATLTHIDYEAAARPELTGRPLEMFVDASDYGWAATLTQRPSPHAAPKIVAIVAKGFTDVQQRWSAMERELYALWQGVVSMERFVRGFRLYCYIDHKNNIFTEAQLDNRRRSKKMSNWALELQQFDLVRVWIRGEANILGDAPSRAPWEHLLAQHLPIPDLPVRDLVNRLYRDPESVELLVAARKVELTGDAPWVPIADATLDAVTQPGYVTPEFGGIAAEALRAEVGLGEVLWGCGPDWPMWPQYLLAPQPIESVLAASVVGRPRPAEAAIPLDFRHVVDERGHNFVIRWSTEILFDDDKRRGSLFFNARESGETVARQQAWDYFLECYRRVGVSQTRVRAKQRAEFGALGPPDDSGRKFHGDRDKVFRAWLHYDPSVHHGHLKVSFWNNKVDTFASSEKFCGHCQFLGESRKFGRVFNSFQCLGHESGSAADLVTTDEPPAVLTGSASDGARPDVLTTGTVDRWEFDVGRSAWVRFHNVPRTSLYVPVEVESGCPELGKLQAWAESRQQFEGAALQVYQYNWRECAASPPEASETQWTGETLFYLEAVAPVGGEHDARRVPDTTRSLVERRDSVERSLVDSLGSAGIERHMLIEGQRKCVDFAAIYVVLLADAEGQDRYRTLRAMRRGSPALFPDRMTNDRILRISEKYELIDSLLFRRVYDRVEGELQLRCCVPNTPCGNFELPGIGEKKLGYRERILLEYHNGPLAGHPGREKTTEMVERSWWWPHLFEDVRRWCRRCVTCQAEHGTSGISAWARTEFYSRPFRVLEFDLIKCHDAQTTSAGASEYVLTVVDCFSRWPWIVPIPDRKAKTVANALLTKVMLGLALFPAVLRSDNALEFVSEIVECMNRTLEIRHVLGSVYHPQSQGAVERLNRSVNEVVRALVEGHPEDWETRLPFAETILRISPMPVLGGRSPYEVVTGLRPTLPSMLDARHNVREITVDEYSKNLLEHFRSTQAEIERVQEAMVENRDKALKGRLSAELHLGDVVLVKRVRDERQPGPVRFHDKTYPGLCRVRKKINVHTFIVEDLADPKSILPFNEQQHAERLVKVELPVLGLSEAQPRTLEILQEDGVTWVRWRVEKFAVDGRVQLVCLDEAEQGRKQWADLSQVRYRWVR